MHFFFCFFFFFFFFNDTATTEIYTLSLHDALPTPSRLRLLLKPTRRLLSSPRCKKRRRTSTPSPWNPSRRPGRRRRPQRRAPRATCGPPTRPQSRRCPPGVDHHPPSPSLQPPTPGRQNRRRSGRCRCGRRPTLCSPPHRLEPARPCLRR